MQLILHSYLCIATLTFALCNVSITELKVELYRTSLIENLFYKLSVFKGIAKNLISYWILLQAKQESYSCEFLSCIF